MVFNFLQEKLFEENVCEAALQSASADRRRESWRETHTPLSPLIGRVSLFLLVKTIVRSSNCLELVCVKNLRHSFLVSISQYVCNK